MCMTKIKNYLLGYEDMYIMQDNEMFNFSLDSVLLPNFVTLNKKITKILDIGCGNAPIPLILSTKTNAEITGVEIQNDVYTQIETIRENGETALEALDTELETLKTEKNNLKEAYDEA